MPEEIVIFDSEEEFVNEDGTPLVITKVFSQANLPPSPSYSSSNDFQFVSRDIQPYLSQKSKNSAVRDPSFRRKVLRRSKNRDKIRVLKKKTKKS